MNRLTKNSLITDLPMPIKLQESACRQICEQYIYNSCKECPVQECMAKLAAYEKTGLEPEEVKQLNASDASKEESSIKYYNEMRKYRDELREYKRLEEQGLLHIAKIPNGTEIYVIINGIDRITNDVYSNNIIKDTYQYGHTECCCGEMNKDWFLTREEIGGGIK